MSAAARKMALRQLLQLTGFCANHRATVGARYTVEPWDRAQGCRFKLCGSAERAAGRYVLAGLPVTGVAGTGSIGAKVRIVSIGAVPVVEGHEPVGTVGTDLRC